uniref:Uncharacterized protein n=1 Tax=Panagrolaimus superbus TaxID=310955 RepID=A0A914YB46_9BILA
MDVVDLNGSGGSHYLQKNINNNINEDSGRHSRITTENFLSQFTSAAAAGGSTNCGGGSIDSNNVNAAVATLANLVANNNNNNLIHRNNGGGGGGIKIDDNNRNSIVESVNRVASSLTPQSSSNIGGIKKSQCPECGKHMRKGKHIFFELL